MLVVGLTGGIGCGKSSVGRLFEALGAPVIDADTVAREVVEPGTPGFERVVAAFGSEAIAEDGHLDRRFLREQVFSDPTRRRRLEAELHPLIRARILERLHALDGAYAIVIVPLLVENGWQGLFGRIAVVDCPPEVQLARAMERDGQSEEQIRAIMAVQVDRTTRLAAADDIIDNSGDPEHLRAQVGNLHRRYLEAAAASNQR